MGIVLFESMAFYGYLYRSCANLARSINNKSLYELLWLYGFYAALDRFPQNKQVLLINDFHFGTLRFNGNANEIIMQAKGNAFPNIHQGGVGYKPCA